MVLLGKLLPAGSGRAGSGQVVSRICSRYQQKHATRATTTTTTTSTARAGASLHWVVMVAKVANPREARSARDTKKRALALKNLAAKLCFITMLKNRAYMTP